MESTGSFILSAITLIYIAFSASRTRKAKDEIRAEANKLYNSEDEPTLGELERKLDESRMMHEEMEGRYWAHIALLTGIGIYFYSHNGYLALAISATTWIVGDKFLSVKPAKSNRVDI